MTSMTESSRTFQIVALTPPGSADPSIAIAASRAGHLGILDIEFVDNPVTALDAMRKMSRHAGKRIGIKLNADDDELIRAISGNIPANVSVVILTTSKLDGLRARVDTFRTNNRSVVLEVTSLAQATAGLESGVDGLLAKGNEAGGFVGEKTAFVLMQQLVKTLDVPVWVQGGIGLHTAAACYSAGAKGVVLDFQLSLLRESSLPESVKRVITRMDGTETVCIGEKDSFIRIYKRQGTVLPEIPKDGASIARDGQEQESVAAPRSAVRGRISWNENPEAVWPMGQDAAFAASFAQKYGSVGALLKALTESVRDHVRTAVTTDILQKGSPLAKSHATTYPIVQGPMARVSDNAAFLAKVAAAGGLPFAAISQMRPKEISSLLGEVKGLLGDRPWGVGLLGFIESEHFSAQLKAIEPFSPKFAVVAGGLPNHVTLLESKGMRTYVHVPSPAILEMFIDAGVRRFIFEGNECGGHIGPRSGFVLWEAMIEKLLDTFKVGHTPGEFHLLFAGGVHDSVSAAAVAAMAAPLAGLGAKVGIQMGTAYLLTKDITETAAIASGYQKNALRCSETRVLETSPGHALRCCDTPFVESFVEKKKQLSDGRRTPDEVRAALEKLVVGRSRIAAKGLMRNPAYETGSGEPYLVSADDEKQHAEGLYLIGQLAALRNEIFTIQELHEATTGSAVQRLRAFEETASIPLNRHQKSVDIAIVGMSCSFPKAKNLREYWENVLHKVNAISEIPSNRWDWQVYFDEDKKSRDKIYARWGGFLEDMPFDPTKYGIPPSSLHAIEPVHLMTLEMVDAALRDAGYEGKEFARDRTSVIIGTGAGIGELGQKYVMRSTLPMVFEMDFGEVMNRFKEWTEDTFAGILMNVLAGRVANRFNFGGVNYTIDAACASSLAALYNASRELENGSSDMVIVGGVDACQTPFTYTCFSKTNALSPTGSCKVFDEKADGTVISEGLAFLVLKRLEDAERDGDRIYAVLKSVAGSSDGRGMGMTAPRVEGQMLALKRAYDKAGFSPATVELFEAHGTGTVVGDLVEAESATRLLQENGAASQSCAVGSVKSMIGHTKGAAGLAGVIKTALSLYHKVLPPTMGVDKPNPKIDFQNGPLYINTEVRPWVGDESRVRRAGVSAFGFGGTNFHAVLEQYDGRIKSDRSAADVWSAELFLWSGQTKKEIVIALHSLQRALEAGARPPLRDISFTLWEQFREKTKKDGDNLSRLAIVSSSSDDLKEKLSAAAQALNDVDCVTVSDQKGIFYSSGPSARPGKIAFLFPGQGSQYPNMLKELSIIFPEVLDAFERANAALKERFPGKLSSLIFPPPRFSPGHEADQRKKLAETNIAQPAIAAACQGMLNLLKKMSLKADMTAGHSYGEYPALAAAGVFDEDTLYTLSEARGRLIIEAAKGSDLGSMAAVKANVAQLKNIIAGIEGVVIANVNSPRQTVISGEKAAINKAISVLKDRQMHAQLLPVSGAFHSPAVAPAKKSFSEYLETVEFASPKIEVFSNTTAAPHGASKQEIRSCMSEHMVKPVEFVREIEAMYERGARIFIEVGPGSVLTNLTKQILDGRPFLSVATDVQGQAPLGMLLRTLGQLAVNRVSLDLEPLFRGRIPRYLDLNNLAAEGREKYSATTWLVNGSGVRHPSKQMRQREEKSSDGTYRLRERRRSRRTQKEAQHAPMKDSPQSFPQDPDAHAKPLVLPAACAPLNRRLSAGDDADVVMQKYQELMANFLEMQKSVMMAYMQGASPAIPAADPSQVFHRNNTEMPLQTPATKPQVSEPLSNQVQSPAARGASPQSSSGSVPAAPSGNVVAAAGRLSSNGNLEKELLRVAGEKTGYPAEMLNLDLDIEADLGIDSIKRVEIMGAFIKSLPRSEQERLQPIMEELSRLKTFRKILTAARGASPQSSGGSVPAAPSGNVVAAAGRLSSNGNLEKELLRVAGEKTGYPAEMLNLDLDIEADLGIDSIKRVEIMGAFIKSLPRSEQERLQPIMEELSRLKTFRKILTAAHGAVAGQSRGDTHTTIAPDAGQPNASMRDARDEEFVPRFVLKTVSNPGSKATQSIPSDGVFILTGDSRGVAEVLASQIRKRGGHAVVVRQATGEREAVGREVSADLTEETSVQKWIESIRKEFGRIVGLIHMSPLGNSLHLDAISLKEWKSNLEDDVKSFFHLAKALGKDLRAAGKQQGAWIMAATSLGEYPEGSNGASPGQAGLAGLLKTLAQEWPEVLCRAVHLDGNAPQTRLSDQLLQEMDIRESPVEVIYRGAERAVYRANHTPLLNNAGEQMQINKEWVILITGGASGITSEVAHEIAIHYKPTLLLSGRSALPAEESPNTAGLTAPRDIKEQLIRESEASGKKATPAAIEAAYARLMKDREIRRNLEMLRQTGAVVHYFQADARDENAFGGLIASIYRTFGRLDGIIHGAGIVEDKLLEDKQTDSFDRVFDTKTESAFILSRAVKAETLKFVVFFTSVAGCFGNRGQSDYAAANEVVNKFAVYLDRQWSGRVVAINWGPWRKIGMVSPALEKQFSERGIQLIPPATGCRMLLDELRYGQKGTVEVVIGNGPWMK